MRMAHGGDFYKPHRNSLKMKKFHVIYVKLNTVASHCLRRSFVFKGV